MSDTPESIASQIAELEASLAQPLPEAVRRLVEQQLATLRQQRGALVDLRGIQAGDVSVGNVAGGDQLTAGNITSSTAAIGAGASAAQGSAEVSGTVQGTAVGVNLGTVQNFFGGQPGEDGEVLLAAYLESLAEDCQRLRLHRLTGKRQSGSEQHSQADSLRLQDVYTSLTTGEASRFVVRDRERTVAWLRRLLKRVDFHTRNADQVVPEKVWQMALLGSVLDPDDGGDVREVLYGQRVSDRASPREFLASIDDDTLLLLRLTRPELVLEAIHAERRLVLLGEPGSGKSTALRYLALLLAQRLRGVPLRIPGWPEGDAPVPVVVPLGQVAAALRAGAADAYAALLQVVGDVLEAEVRVGLRRFLTPALRAGGLLLLCDGLDELPATSNGEAPRVAVAAALRRLARETRARIVVTSRVLPYRAPGDWKLLPEDGWALRTVQPLAFGQTRAFVQSWYAALALSDPDLAGGKAAERAEALIAELEQTERLRPLVRSPLLLTMLAILHYNTGDVPRDRAKLYEECVLLLLERWEPERQPGMPREKLIERLGLPSLDPLRQVIHELAYQAHLQPPGDDGRGLIGVEPLTLRMFTFFKRLGSLAEADAKLQSFRTMLDDEDSGLLQRRGDEGYALPHLTFQEYLAACHLADHPRMLEVAYERWTGADRERWREAVLLLMGRLHQQGKAEEKGLPWLKLLAGARQGKAPKEAGQRRWDAVLAALSYAELDERGAFAGSLLDIEAELEAPLVKAIAPLLETPDAAVTITDRIVAAWVLGNLGDPRFPVEVVQWQAEVRRLSRAFGHPAGYFCYVPEGTYPIGGWEPDEEKAEIALQPFWIARFPITVAQCAPFVAEGYGPDAERWWTPEGWKWKRDRAQPWGWRRPEYSGLNQPVIGVTWYEATAFCNWLTERLGLDGYVVRLPTEAEWEAAASYDGSHERRSYPWGREEPTPERAIYDESRLGRPAPVGCCPDGAAACSALDLVGNVWEWTASSYQGYPVQSDGAVEDFTGRNSIVSLRGGSHFDNKKMCAAGRGSSPLAMTASTAVGVFGWRCPLARTKVLISAFRILLSVF